MKNFNRRDFLKLTGASALTLTLAACGGGGGGGGSVRPAEKDAQALYNAISAYRKEKKLKAFIYDSTVEDYAKWHAECFEDVGEVKVITDKFNEWCEESDHDQKSKAVASAALKKGLQLTSGTKYYGIADPDGEMSLTKLCPKTEKELEAQMKEIADISNDSQQYYIGIALATVKGNTYWIALLTTKKS